MVSRTTLVFGTVLALGAGLGVRGARAQTPPAFPEITVSPTSLSFGEQPAVAGPTTGQLVQITNDGTATLTFGPVIVAGVNPADFAIDEDSGEPFLTPGQTRTLSIAFDPVVAGGKLATLRIASNDGDEPTVQVALSGTGTNAMPEVTVSPSALVFGEQPIDLGPTASQVVSVTNVGGTTMVIESVSVLGPSLPAFPIESDSGEAILGAGETRFVSLYFDPETPGDRVAFLRVLTNDGDESTVDVPLAGVGTESGSATSGCSQGGYAGWWGLLLLLPLRRRRPRPTVLSCG